MSVLKDLRRYSQRSLLDIEESVDQLSNELISESDRGVVIVLAAMLEEILEAFVRARLQKLDQIPGLADKLFGAERPLSSFSAKIAMAAALGVVDEDLYRRIDGVRALRNACAHAQVGMRLDVPELAECLFLIVPEAAPALKGAAAHHLRSLLIWATDIFLHEIELGGLDDLKDKLLRLGVEAIRRDRLRDDMQFRLGEIAAGRIPPGFDFNVGSERLMGRVMRERLERWTRSSS